MTALCPCNSLPSRRSSSRHLSRSWNYGECNRNRIRGTWLTGARRKRSGTRRLIATGIMLRNSRHTTNFLLLLTSLAKHCTSPAMEVGDVRHRITPCFGTSPIGDGEIDAPGASLSPSQGSHTSGNCVNLASHASYTQRCDSAVSGNPLPHLLFVHSKTQPIGREENCAHGETSPPQIWHTAGETAPAVAEAGTGSDRRYDMSAGSCDAASWRCLSTVHGLIARFPLPPAE